MSTPLHFDEAIASGAVRIELRGDPDSAQAHVLTARKVLGRMRSMYGINARIAAGEPGGLFRRVVALADGSTIEATSNNGLDTLRITSARAGSTAVGALTLHGGDTVGALHAPAAAFTPDAHDTELRFEADTARDEQGVAEEPARTDFAPYLWVGVRFADPDARFKTFAVRDTAEADRGSGLHLCVWLPPERDGDDPVIISNRSHLARTRAGLEDPVPAAIYPLQDPPNLLPDGDHYGVAYSGSAAGTPSDTLRAYQLSRPPSDDADAGYQLPGGADTYAPDEDADSGAPWEEVVIVDPLDAMGLGLDAGIDPAGTYYIKVAAMNADCPPSEPIQVELRVIAGSPDSDGYTDRTFTFTIDEVTDYLMGIMPFGWYEPDSGPPLGTRGCSENVLDNGENPHGRHWWQGGVVVEMPPAQLAVAADAVQLPDISVYDEADALADQLGVLLPPTGFVPAGFPDKAALCAYCDYESYSVDFTVSALVAGSTLLSVSAAPVFTSPSAAEDAELAARGLAPNANFHGLDGPDFPRSTTWYDFIDLGTDTTYLLMPGWVSNLYTASARGYRHYDAYGAVSLDGWEWDA